MHQLDRPQEPRAVRRDHEAVRVLNLLHRAQASAEPVLQAPSVTVNAHRGEDDVHGLGFLQRSIMTLVLRSGEAVKVRGEACQSTGARRLASVENRNSEK